jgi:hypothetical protein
LVDGRNFASGVYNPDRVRVNVKSSWATFVLKLCHSVPVDICKNLKTSSQQKKQGLLLAICKRIEELGGELPINWLDCELIYLERFAQKLQRKLDRQVIGF